MKRDPILDDHARAFMDLVSAENPTTKPQVCQICGIPWRDGVGFEGEHISPCANARHGWNFTKDAPAEQNDEPA